MTTDFSVTLIPDIRRRNSFFYQPENDFKEDAPIGGIQFCADQFDKYQASVDVFKFILSANQLPAAQYSATLLVGQAGWTMDNRIVRYKKLWRNLEDKGIQVPDSMRNSETIHQRGSEIRYYGSTVLCPISIPVAAELIESPSLNSIVVIIPADSESEINPTYPWHMPPHGFDSRVLREVIDARGLLCWRETTFDYVKYAFTGIGYAHDVRTFHEALKQ